MNNKGFRNRSRSITDTSNRQKNEGIFSLWEEQKRIESEDKKMQDELKQTKQRAKELKRTLREQQYGEFYSSASAKSKELSESAVKVYKKSTAFVTVNRKVSFGFAALLVIVFGVAQFSRNPDSSKTLGERTSNSLTIADQELPREKPKFSLLYPEGENTDNYDVVRISPPEAEASYTYLDRFSEDGQIFRVTQQEIPKDFDLAKIATDFQATSVIQVDATTVYHGYSESGGVQSLIFIKDDKLLTIRSTQKFSDDQWASYVVSLN